MCIRDSAQALDQHGGRTDGRGFKQQIAAHVGDILEQLVEVARHGEFFHGADNLAALDFIAAGKQREIAADRVCARMQAGDFGQEQAVAEVGEQLFLRQPAGLEEQVCRRDPACARRVSGRLAAGLFGGLTVCLLYTSRCV